jgi:hypothetical protein
MRIFWKGREVGGYDYLLFHFQVTASTAFDVISKVECMGHFNNWVGGL